MLEVISQYFWGEGVAEFYWLGEKAGENSNSEGFLPENRDEGHPRVQGENEIGKA